MDYVELNITVADSEQAEILTAELADFPFESFDEGQSTLKAYIPGEKLVDCKESIDALLERYAIVGARYISIETQNWNALWESNFEQVDVDGELLIRAPFHAPASADYKMEVIVMPKMSFGTGHHATTHLMSAGVMLLEVEGRSGLDMGSGTGVLAIIAAKRGAASVDAIDIDEWADENCRENIAVNQVEGIVHPSLGDGSALESDHYDFVLANINRNILTANMQRFYTTLHKGGDLLLSGFLTDDVEVIINSAKTQGFEHQNTTLRNGWAMVHVRK